jgi:hypothetical protein
LWFEKLFVMAGVTSLVWIFYFVLLFNVVIYVNILYRKMEGSPYIPFGIWGFKVYIHFRRVFLEMFILKAFIGFFFGFVHCSFICIQFFCVIFCLQVFFKTFILKFLSFCFMQAMCFHVFLLCANFLLKCICFTLLSSPSIEARV